GPIVLQCVGHRTNDIPRSFFTRPCCKSFGPVHIIRDLNTDLGLVAAASLKPLIAARLRHEAR
ncbi:MAG: hypothetical protein AB7I48_20705, partial [Planctomycetaceae bacterium]